MASVNVIPVTITLREDVDIVRARQAAHRLAEQCSLSARARARLDLVVAELTSNVVRHAGHGSISLHACPGVNERPGVSVVCTDDGPGMPVEGVVASTPSGLGLGLKAARELADALSITPGAGRGVRVEAVVWA